MTSSNCLRVLVAAAAAIVLFVCIHILASGAPATDVMSIRFSSEAGSDALRDARDRVYRATEKQARYLLGTVHPWSEDAGLRLLTDSRCDEHWIRPNAGAVAGFAFLYRFGPYDEAIVGVSRAQLLNEFIVPMMRYLVATHRTGSRPTSDGRPWGDQWQSAHWSHSLAHAAWWAWPNLPLDVREGVRRVVAHEADRIAASEPPHQIKEDSKSEENAWNSQILSVAVLLMPNDGRRPGWEAAFQKWALSAYLRPADATSEQVVDGRPLRDQFTGASIYDDFTLENHGIVHPDYMAAFGLSLGCSLDYALTGRRPPEALQHNVAGIYENLKWFLLPDAGFVYPSGQDWRLFRNPDWVLDHVLMAVVARDPEAWTLALRGLETLERMQARSASGAVYYPGEYFFPSTQHDMIYHLGLTWLSLQLVDALPEEQRERTGVRRLDSGKILINRTPRAVHTFSWGARCMAQCLPYRMDRVVSPDPRNGIGHVRVAGSKDALPIHVRDVAVTSDASSFTAEVVVDHGQKQVRAYLTYRSTPDGTWVIREKLVAQSDVATSEIATGLIGILNNAHWVYEDGRRAVTLGDRRTVVESGSGIVLDSDSAADVVVDSALKVHGTNPLRVRYLSATNADRGRVTDRLYLNYRGDERGWHKGDVISEYEATVYCVPDTTSRPAALLNGQIEELKRLKQRIVANLTLSTLPADNEACREYLAQLDARVDRLLAMPGGYWAVYPDVNQPPISANGYAWGDPLCLAAAYASRGSWHYRSQAVLKAAEDGLRHLLRFAHPGCPQPGNWWSWQIGIPRNLLPTLYLLEGTMDEDLRSQEIDTLIYLLESDADTRLTGPWRPSAASHRGKTDTNALWHHEHRLHLAVLLENPAMAGKWAERSFGEIAPAGVGHFQADGSFQFHGPIPMWAYGDSFLGDYAGLVRCFAGSEFGPRREQLELFRRMAESYVEGFLYRGRICPAMIGRTLTRSDRHFYVSYGPAGFYALAVLAQAGLPDAESVARKAVREKAFFPLGPAAWAALATGFSCWDNRAEILHPAGARLAEVASGLPDMAPAPLTNGLFAYPDSDFLQVTRPDWAVGIKMHSARTRAFESINGENLQGWFLSHGSMFHFIRGDEWDGCWPTLDWTRLPGTTVAAEVKGNNESPFVGVLRASPTLALAAMELRSGGFTARKSWFVNGDEIVCVGSGIAGSGRVETTVFNHPVPPGALLLMDGQAADAGSFEKAVPVRWVWLQDVGYVFPGGAGLRIGRTSRTSDWSSVRDPKRFGSSSPATHEYLTGVIQHTPANPSYCYVMLPNVSAATMPDHAAQIATRYTVAADGPHRVRVTGDPSESVVFWDAGRAGAVEADRACMMVRHASTWQVVDPTRNPESMRVKLEATSHELRPTGGRPARLEAH